MTTFKTALLAATALTLMSGAAFAQNQSFTSQSGAGNTALVEQGGAGSNVAGSAGDPIFQNGANNEIDIDQTNDLAGSTNFVGAGTDTGVNAGVDQSGDGNVLDVTQSGRRITTFQVQQIGGDNEGTVSQTGNSVSISAINQTGDRNEASVTQSGNTNLVGRSAFRAQNTTFSGIGQTGDDNVLTLTQQGGTGNVTRAATQDGDGNDAALTITGSSNGAQGVTVSSTAGTVGTFNGGFADGVGFASGRLASIVTTEQSVIDQNGDDNSLTVDITGNSNLYGFSQTANAIGAGTITGSVTGSSNQLSIGQVGNATAGVTINGSSNDVGLSQQTNTSAAAVVTASLDIQGSGNRLGVDQAQNGNATTSLTVNITGENNNAMSLGAFSGDAGSIFFSRTPGLIEQLGSNNTITLDVGSAGNDADNNLFSLRQSSAGNTITGTINGSMNQAVVSQSGGDTATFTQTGSGNNLGVSQ